MTWRQTRWGLLVVLAVLAASGCTGFGTNCSTDADCRAQNPESICDPALKVCFVYDGPVVTEIAPADQATDVIAANGQVVATFSRPIVDAGVTASTFLVVGQDFDTFGTYVFNADATEATFEPLAGGLALGTNYSVSLTSGIEDGAGKALLPFASTFSTKDGAFGAGGTLGFATATGAYTMAGNYFGNLVTLVDIYTGAGISNDYALKVGVSDVGSTPVVDVFLQNIVGEEANNTSAAIAPNGTAFAAWTTQPTDGGIGNFLALVAVFDPRLKTWVSITTLAGPDPDPQLPLVVAFNPVAPADVLGDDGLAVWLETVGSKKNVWGDYHNSDAGWLGSGSIQSNPALGASNVSVAADMVGNVLVAWQSEQAGSGPPQILAVYRPIAGTQVPTVALSANNVVAVVPQVALGITGLGAAVWPQQTFETDGGIATSHVFASSFDPTRTPSFGPPVRLDSAANFANFPRVGVSANGDAFAIWQELGAVVTSTYTVDAGSWSPPVTLDSDPTFVVNGPAVVVDPGGNAIASWVKFATDGGYQLYGGRYTADAGWHGKTQLTVGVDPVQDFQPAMAVDAMGRSYTLETRVPGAGARYLTYIPFQ
jgi:Bacterial Ig-like domain